MSSCCPWWNQVWGKSACEQADFPQTHTSEPISSLEPPLLLSSRRGIPVTEYKRCAVSGNEIASKLARRLEPGWCMCTYDVVQNRAENAGTCCKWPLWVPQDNQETQKFQDYELRILIIHKFTSILIFLAGGTWVVWEETAWKETKTKKTSRRNSRTNLVPASHVYHSNGVISSWLSFRTFCDCSDLKTLMV